MLASASVAGAPKGSNQDFDLIPLLRRCFAHYHNHCHLLAAYKVPAPLYVFFSVCNSHIYTGKEGTLIPIYEEQTEAS